MAKTTVLHARMDEDLKNSVEKIFEQLGLTSSDAIKLFYKQVQLNGGLPFEVKVPEKLLAETRLMAELYEGEQSAKEKGAISLKESRAKYGV